MPVNEFESTSRGSRGKAGTKTQEDDEVKLFISCNDHDTLLLFSDRGVSYALPAYRVPLSSSCLLYTSPSPRDRTRSRMPSSA